MSEERVPPKFKKATPWKRQRTARQRADKLRSLRVELARWEKGLEAKCSMLNQLYERRIRQTRRQIEELEKQQ